MNNYRQILADFQLANIPNLDIAVLGALELFSEQPLKTLDLSQHYQRPLIVGSGNAEATSRIIFEKFNALFANESNYLNFLNDFKDIDGIIIVSASGAKHAPIIAEEGQKRGLHISLITNNPNSDASRYLDHSHDYDEFVFPKNREPYTYNTSTYLGMILGYTQENPQEIADFINNQIASIQFPDFSHYDKYYVIVPAKFSQIKRMIQIKFIELFGRNIARDVETADYVPHATTVASSNELFISFGEENKLWGQVENRLYIPLPEHANYGAMMAISYYIVSRIQAVYPNYFKDNIADYCQFVSAIFKENITPIVQ